MAITTTQPFLPTYQFKVGTANHNVYHANKGDGLPKHNHTFPHIVICVNGSCLIKKEGKELTINKHSQPVNLVAVEWHEIESLEDNTVFINIFEQP